MSAGINIIAARPSRLYLTNARTGEAHNMQFNPTEFSESLGVEFARHTVPGLSHKVMQYVATENRTVPLELYFNAGNYPAQTKQQGQNPFLIIRRFLRSLCYPRQAGGRVTGGSPRVIVTWPSFLSLTCFVTSLEIKHLRFNLNGSPVVSTASITLEEVRDVVRFSEEVLEMEWE